MIPIYVFYSMFGFQRTGDSIWAAADQMTRGFLIGATAGRTTLTGEGLQHADGHSPLLASTNPAVVPTTRPTATRSRTSCRTVCVGCTASPRTRDESQRHLLPHGLQRADVQPAEPETSTVEGILRGMYLYAADTSAWPHTRRGAVARLGRRRAVGPGGPGVGERVGIAFSGGLDTQRRRLDAREGRRSPAPTPPTSASTTSPTIDEIPPSAPWAYGAELARAWSTAARSWSRRASSPWQCGAFHIRTGGAHLLQHHPLGRAVTGTMLVRAMKEDDVNIWGDGSTYKGNDIERFYRYGLLANPR
jgi:hypothetical protein